jgi:solute carrier family 25 (adenine nucleotide translocator) protein 4/5/6/31
MSGTAATLSKTANAP